MIKRRKIRLPVSLSEEEYTKLKRLSLTKKKSMASVLRTNTLLGRKK